MSANSGIGGEPQKQGQQQQQASSSSLSSSPFSSGGVQSNVGAPLTTTTTTTTGSDLMNDSSGGGGNSTPRMRSSSPTAVFAAAPSSASSNAGTGGVASSSAQLGGDGLSPTTSGGLSQSVSGGGGLGSIAYGLSPSTSGAGGLSMTTSGTGGLGPTSSRLAHFSQGSSAAALFANNDTPTHDSARRGSHSSLGGQTPTSVAGAASVASNAASNAAGSPTSASSPAALGRAAAGSPASSSSGSASSTNTVGPSPAPAATTTSTAVAVAAPAAAAAAAAAAVEQHKQQEQKQPQKQQQQQAANNANNIAGHLEQGATSTALLVPVTPSSKDIPLGYVVGALLRDIAVHHVTLNRFNSSLPASHVIRSLTVFESSIAPPLDIADYFHRLQHYLQAEDSICIAVLLLLRRYVKQARRPLTVYNVHRLAVVAMLVATKLYSDFFFCCRAVALVGGIPTKELARMEVHFLVAINWDGAIANRFETASEIVRAKAAHMMADQERNLRPPAGPQVSRFSRLFPDTMVVSDVLRAEKDAAPVAGAANMAQAWAALEAVAANNPASQMTVESVAARRAEAQQQQIDEDEEGNEHHQQPATAGLHSVSATGAAAASVGDSSASKRQ